MLTTIASFLLVFSIVIIIHELGHFLAARLLSIKAYEFSIGFPFSPRVLTLFRHRETIFTLRLLPLGGFVSFSKEGDEGFEYLSVSRWKRAIVSAAGSVFNIVFAFLAIAIALMLGKGLVPLEALTGALSYIQQGIVGTFTVLASLFGGASMDGLTGPVGIAVLAGKAAATGVAGLIFFTGVLSLSLGIFNLLPLPALDGGHLVILLIESIKGRPLKVRTYGFIAAAGLAAFVALALFVTYKDILRLMA